MRSDSGSSPTRTATPQVSLRRFPYPYDALLAICSDLDNTPNRHVYREIMRYLNTREMTTMGPGVGLEVGNSIFFDMPVGEFAYWNTDDAGREMIQHLIRSGHIDVLHSYGDLATTRAHSERALEELDRHNCHLPVWVDHRRVASNFGLDVTRGAGDVPGRPCYHADLTLAHGVRYVWRGRVTSVVGQNAPHSLHAIWNPRAPLRATRTLVKETVKHILAQTGNQKYAMHGANALLRPVTLRDGSATLEFLRCNPHWAGIEHGDTARQLGDILADQVLDRLEARRGVAVIYTHLAKRGDPERPFNDSTRAALQKLATRHEARRILVTTTYRLLRFVEVRDRLRYHTTTVNNTTTIHIESVAGPACGTYIPTPADLQGLTFVTAAGRRPVVNDPRGESIDCDVIRNGSTTYVTIPWRPLTFPDLDTCN